MIEIKSKLEPEEDAATLHIIHRLNESKHHLSLTDESDFIQCLVLQKDKGKKFVPHSHVYNTVKHTEQIAQEAWLVVRGSIRCFYYDLDDSFLGCETLHNGDISITLHGGHTFEILEDDTIVYEFKNGPYYGKDYDKRIIND